MRYLGARCRQGVLFTTMVLALGLAALAPGAQADPQQSAANALASLGVSASNCSTPTLSQPFASWHDFAYYTPAPGQSGGSFLGAGWTLLNGAAVTTATTADGSSGQVLNLPSGSLAITPPMCVDLDYPTARVIVRNVVGGGGVHVFVSYANGSRWGRPRDGGSAHGRASNWALSGQIHLQPSHAPGWQLVRFVLAPDGTSKDHNAYQVYSFYVDPYAKG